MGGSARSAARMGASGLLAGTNCHARRDSEGPTISERYFGCRNRAAISAVEIEPLFRQDRGCRGKLAGKRTTLVLANNREMADLATFENNKLKFKF